jgi:hypothetical protein
MDALDAYASDSDSSSNNDSTSHRVVAQQQAQMSQSSTTDRLAITHEQSSIRLPRKENCMIQWDKDYITPKLKQYQLKQRQRNDTSTTFASATTTAVITDLDVQSLEQQHAFHNPHFLAAAHQRLFGNVDTNPEGNLTSTTSNNITEKDPTLFSIQTIMAKEEQARIMQPPP